jgi:cell division septation protein DedD
LPELGAKPTPTPAPSAAASTTAAAAAPAAQGVGVQLAAYGTRARAEEGWTQISRRTPLLSGVKYRVVEGKVDIGTVYRLQAVTPNRAEAEKLCAGLKAAGVDCQIK